MDTTEPIQLHVTVSDTLNVYASKAWLKEFFLAVAKTVLSATMK